MSRFDVRLIGRRKIPRSQIVSRESEILRLCTNKKILHLGCADVPYTQVRGENLLHKQLEKVTSPSMLWGLDTSEQGVAMLRQMGFDHVIHGNAEQRSAELEKEGFDIILAGEIIEHIDNPGLFLQSITSIMTEKTELILTTVNAFAFKGFLHTIMCREKVHEDHNYYFSYLTLQQLLEKLGLKCKEIYFYQEVRGDGLSKILDKILSLPMRISPVWADGLIVRATL